MLHVVLLGKELDVGIQLVELGLHIGLDLIVHGGGKIRPALLGDVPGLVPVQHQGAGGVDQVDDGLILKILIQKKSLFAYFQNGSAHIRPKWDKICKRSGRPGPLADLSDVFTP